MPPGPFPLLLPFPFPALDLDAHVCRWEGENLAFYECLQACVTCPLRSCFVLGDDCSSFVFHLLCVYCSDCSLPVRCLVLTH